MSLVLVDAFVSLVVGENPPDLSFIDRQAENCLEGSVLASADVQGAALSVVRRVSAPHGEVSDERIDVEHGLIRAPIRPRATVGTGEGRTMLPLVTALTVR